MKESFRHDIKEKFKKPFIKKHIHQIWIGNKEPPYIYINSWKDDYISKNKNWQYTLWNEEKIETIFQNNIKEQFINVLYKLYKQELTMMGKADIARIVILYYNGGVYIDADSVWINNKSLDSLIDKSFEKGFFCALEQEGCPYLTNGVIGSLSKHKNLLRLMNILANYEDIYLQLRENYQPWEITGPLLINQLDRSTITLFPSIYFYTISWHGIKDCHLHKKIKLPEESYMFQYGISTNDLDYSQEYESEFKIPKIIIQTWKTNEISGKIGNLINKLKYNNPNFEYKFYTDDDIVEFIKTKYPEYYSTFISFEYTIQKIDFFRLICVYHYGGFYFDIDMEINKSIEPLCKYDCVFPKESDINDDLLNFKNQNMNILLGNYAFGASPKNSFIKLCIDNIINKRIKLSDIPNNNDRFESYVENTPSHMKKSQSYIDHVLYTTGPVLVSQSYIDYNFKDKIKIIELTPFKIYTFGDYGKHLEIGTWKGMENIKTRDKNMVYRKNKNMKNDINYNLKILKEDSLNKIENNILFSCTTYLTNHTKYEILKKTLDTFIKYNKDDLHLINEFVIMMEYTENNKRYLDKLKQRYPNFIFIQKNKNQKGQAKSLNMIIDKLKDYKLWLHWEDSWYSIGPILKKAYDTLNSSEINYLQLIKKDNIYNIPEINNQHLECKIINDYKIIKPNEMLKKMWRYWEINDFDWSIWKESGWWPFFSLTPLLTDTNIILTTGYFNEDLNKWPFQFEFEWSLRWIRKNKIKLGVFKNINVIRDEDRESTYKQKNYENWEKNLECREKKENYNRNVKYYTLKSDKLKIIFFGIYIVVI